MALIACYECGHHISEHAESCPQCGAPNQKSAKDESRPYAKRKSNDEIYQEQRVSELILVDDLLTEIENVKAKQKIFNIILGFFSLIAFMFTAMAIIAHGYEKEHAADSSVFFASCAFLLAATTYFFSFESKIKELKKKVKFERNWAAKGKK